MPADITPNTLLQLKQLATTLFDLRLDGRNCQGRPLAVSTLRRAIRHGKHIGGNTIKLKAIYLPAGWHTSIEEWLRYVSCLTSTKGASPLNPVTSSESPHIISISPKDSKRLGGKYHRPESGRPKWDEERGELFFSNIRVKAYRQSAENQRLLLSAFEKAGWPKRIPDPLPPTTRVLAGQRLGDTIRRLNKNTYLLFERDGKGGVLWRPAKAPIIPFLAQRTMKRL